MLKIFCKNTGTVQEFDEGVSLLDISEKFEFEKAHAILCAKVNNTAQGLRFKAYHNLDVEFLDYRNYIGRGFYCRSLCLLLYKVCKDLFPEGTLTIRRPISKGYFCTLDRPSGSQLSDDDVEIIKKAMTDLVERDLPIRRHETRIEDAIRIMQENGCHDTAKLLRTSGEVYMTLYSVDGTVGYQYDELVPSTGYLKVFDLVPYKNGFLLRVPDRHQPDELAPMLHQHKTFEVFSETHKWNQLMDLSNVGDVNDSILAGNASDLISIAEALQEKRLCRLQRR